MKYLEKNSGYAYAGGNLYKVEVVRQEISRADESSEPIIELTVKTGDGKEFQCGVNEIFESPAAYEEGCPIKLRAVDNITELYGISYRYFIVEDSQVKEVNPNNLWRTLVGIPEGSIFSFECDELPKEYYDSENEAKSFNCITVVDENGESHEEKGGALLARLEDDQRAIISQLEEILEKAKNAGIRIYFDTDDERLYAFNGRNGVIYSSYDKEDEGWKEIAAYGHKEFIISESIVQTNFSDEAFYFEPETAETENAEEK